MNDSYETAYSKLEKIVKDLESDNISLEESISKYEEGISLFKYCQKKLEEYEGKVKILTREDKDILEKDFNYEDECNE